MISKNGMSPVHPGEILKEELTELGMSAQSLARAIKVPVNRITAVLNGERGITADTARRLARYFGTSTEFWMNLQQSYEIRVAEVADSQNQIDEIVPRETALLREVVHDLTLEPLPSSAARTALEVIESNLTLCTQLQTYELMARIGDLNTETMRAFEGPLSELRDSGVFETGLADHLPHTIATFKNYEDQFKPSTELKSRRLERRFVANTDSAFESPLPMLRRLDGAWLNELDGIASMQRVVNLRDLGSTLNENEPFSPACADDLQKLLGDWRDEITWPKVIRTDLGARMSFYEELGFDINLTCVPSSAFQEILDATAIKPDQPDPVQAYEYFVQTSINLCEERMLARTMKACSWIERLETQLRHFIDHAMTKVYGIDWIERRFPKQTVTNWEKTNQRIKELTTLTLQRLAFSQFTDYELVICQEDHWNEVFRSVFKNREYLRESLQRLYPIRNDTMIGRPITNQDELLLYVETNRLISAMEAADGRPRSSNSTAVFWTSRKRATRLRAARNLSKS